MSAQESIDVANESDSPGGELDAYDLQDILRCIETTAKLVRQNLAPDHGPTHYERLAARYYKAIASIGIDRYGANELRIKITAEEKQ